MDAALRTLHLQTLLSSTSVGVAATDAAGRMTMLSPALEALIGPPSAYLDESQMSDHFHLYCEDGTTPIPPEDLPITRARLGETVRDAVVVARPPGRTEVYLRCNGAPLRDTDGEIVGAIVLVQDISCERAALREQEELRRRLVTTINHEFRTPLTAVVGNVELLEDLADQLPPGAARLLAAIAEGGRRLEELVRTVSELADLEGDTLLVKSECDVARLVRDVCDDIDRARAGGPTVVVDAPGRVAGVADDAKLRKAVAALLDNALTHAAETDEVVVRVTSDELALCIRVCDEGTGVALRDRERLVQPFERGQHPGQPVSSRGLGLAVARTVAVAHGGRLVLDDNTPHGLCATIALPHPGAGVVVPRARPEDAPGSR